MCVNEGPRADCKERITNLGIELENEQKKRKDIVRARDEINQLLDEADCAINNLGNCDFGGTRILDSVEKSRQGYRDRKNYYEDYIVNCNNAIENILHERTQALAELANYPVPCGVCYECAPPLEDIQSGDGGDAVVNTEF